MKESDYIGLAIGAAHAAARAAATNQAAKAEGITFEEMRLREKAARYRSGAISRWTARGRRNAAARAAACDEQLARFEETRRGKMNEAGDGTPLLPTVSSYAEECHFCNKCGVQNGEKDNFCHECGTQFFHHGNYPTARISNWSPDDCNYGKINYQQ